MKIKVKLSFLKKILFWWILCFGFACQPKLVTQSPAFLLFSLKTSAGGLSDLAKDHSEQFWAIPERSRFLLSLEISSTEAKESHAYQIEGIKAGVDTESFAWLSSETLVLGTETQESNRQEDLLLFARFEKAKIVIIDSLSLPYKLWGIKAERNRGIEGLCVQNNFLLAAVETVIQNKNGRFAPLARIEVSSRTIEPFRIKLTTKTGKISALSCQASPDNQSIKVLAIERHYGVLRIISFTIPLAEKGNEIEPNVLIDLSQQMKNLPNFEGIAIGPKESLLLLSDNNTGGLQSSNTQILLLPKQVFLKNTP